MPRTTRASSAAAAALALLAALIVPASASAAPVERVSNERSRTHTAVVIRPAWIRAEPRRAARKLHLLTRWTYFGSRERVTVLARTVDTRGAPWSKVRYSGLGVRTGWVMTKMLSHPRRLRTRLVIDRDAFTIALFRGGKRIFRAPVGVGAPGSPTPSGRFYVRERLVPPAPGGVYGILAFGLSAYSPFRTDWPGGGQVGVHGTNQPYLIPGRISNGCVRMRNSAIRRLDRLMPVGTPLLIK